MDDKWSKAVKAYHAKLTKNYPGQPDRVYTIYFRNLYKVAEQLGVPYRRQANTAYDILRMKGRLANPKHAKWFRWALGKMSIYSSFMMLDSMGLYESLKAYLRLRDEGYKVDMVLESRDKYYEARCQFSHGAPLAPRLSLN